jgi:hypothetical protein
MTLKIWTSTSNSNSGGGGSGIAPLALHWRRHQLTVLDSFVHILNQVYLTSQTFLTLN